MGKLFRRMLCMCDRRSERRNEKPMLKISAPTDFRREDITIPGLDPEQQRYIREKAITDAERMWEHLQPLQSLPSTEFATRPSTAAGGAASHQHEHPAANAHAAFPSREAFTRPRGAPAAPGATGKGGKEHRRSLSAQLPATMSRLRAHSRRLSNSLTQHNKTPGYGVVELEGSGPYDHHERMVVGSPPVLPRPQTSGTFSLGGETEVDRDSVTEILAGKI